MSTRRDPYPPPDGDALILLGLGILLGVLIARPACAAEPPPPPALVEQLPSMPDCPGSLELTPGERWVPPDWLVDAQGVVQCRAVLEPYTSLADLLIIETDYHTLRGLYRVDTLTLELKLDHWQGRALAAEAVLAAPTPFFQRRETAAWLGRVEVLALVGVVAWGLHEVDGGAP